MRQDLQKARALGNALLFFLVVPWTLTLIFYTGVTPAPYYELMFGLLCKPRTISTLGSDQEDTHVVVSQPPNDR